MIFHYHYQWNKAQERERNEVAVEEHLAYIAALKSRDPGKVDAACHRHLKSARHTLLTSIPETGSRAAVIVSSERMRRARLLFYACHRPKTATHFWATCINRAALPQHDRGFSDR